MCICMFLNTNSMDGSIEACGAEKTLPMMQRIFVKTMHSIESSVSCGARNI